MGKTYYRVRGWADYFETHETRKLKEMRWIPIPTKQDGKSYRRVAGMKSRCELFSAWILMLEVAAKAPRRGILADEDGAYTAEDLSCMTGFPREIFEKAFEVFADPKIGWLEMLGEIPEPTEQNEPEISGIVVKSGDSPATTGESADISGNRTGQDIAGQNKEEKSSLVAKFSALCAPSTQMDWEWLDEVKKDPSYAEINIEREYSKAIKWHQRRQMALTKTLFMSWLDKCEKPLRLNFVKKKKKSQARKSCKKKRSSKKKLRR